MRGIGRAQKRTGQRPCSSSNKSWTTTSSRNGTAPIDEAKTTWQHNAVGKLGVRRVPGKESRFVLDSRAPGLNGGVAIEEQAFNPTVADVKELFGPGIEERWQAFALDIKAAHK